MPNNLIAVHLVHVEQGVTVVLRSARQAKGLRAEKVDSGPHLVDAAYTKTVVLKGKKEARPSTFLTISTKRKCHDNGKEKIENGFEHENNSRRLCCWLAGEQAYTGCSCNPNAPQTPYTNRINRGRYGRFTRTCTV